MVLGTLVYLLLRRPFADVADAAPWKHVRSILKRLLLIGLVFPDLLHPDGIHRERLPVKWRVSCTVKAGRFGGRQKIYFHFIVDGTVAALEKKRKA